MKISFILHDWSILYHTKKYIRFKNKYIFIKNYLIKYQHHNQKVSFCETGRICVGFQQKIWRRAKG